MLFFVCTIVFLYLGIVFGTKERIKEGGVNIKENIFLVPLKVITQTKKKGVKEFFKVIAKYPLMLMVYIESNKITKSEEERKEILEEWKKTTP